MRKQKPSEKVPERVRRDDRTKIDLDPEDALKAILKTPRARKPRPDK